jgi:hypothetical protein
MMQPDESLNKKSKEMRIDFNGDALIPIKDEPNHFLAYPNARHGKPFSSLSGHFNPISTFGYEPDNTLAMLQQVAGYRLTVEQKAIAKMSGIELLNRTLLSGRSEICILDLVKSWEDSPELAMFAATLRNNMLP